MKMIINNEIIGLKHMWKVIQYCSNFNVTIQMINELIKLYHSTDKHTISKQYFNTINHIELSGGIICLFKKCDQQFNKYIITNITNLNFKQEYITIKYLILLRRIVEYSIGKTNMIYNINSNQKIKLQIHYHFKNKKKNYICDIEKNISLNTSIVWIRQKIAKLKLIDCQHNVRKIELYRKDIDNRFILIEENSLPYLTCNDLISIDKKPLKLNKSISSKYMEDYNQFIHLKKFIKFKFFTSCII
eukprot:114894_1